MNLEHLCPHCMRELQEGQNICPYCGKDTGQEAEVQHQLKPFTILMGKYLVGDVIGEGGFGITYIGFDLNLETRVAIKEFYPNGYVTREAQVTSMLTAYTGQSMDTVHKWRDSFVKEARTLAKFTGLSGIVGVKDFFQENNTAYIIMEYLEGETLKSYMKSRGGKIPADELLYMMKPVIASLDEVHKAGLIHRDISPDNLMLLKGGQIKLLDFGAARDYTANGEKSLSVLLKPGYAPEEQYRTKGKQGPWSDVYALCATMYKCITGVTPPESMERMREDKLKRPGELGISLSPQIENALIKGMAVFAEERCQSMSELYDMLFGNVGEQFAIEQDMKPAGLPGNTENLVDATVPSRNGSLSGQAAAQNEKLVGQFASAQGGNLTGQTAAVQSETSRNVGLDEQSVVTPDSKPAVGKIDKNSVIKWFREHRLTVCGGAICLVVLLIAIIVGGRSSNKEQGNIVQADGIPSGQTQNSSMQGSGQSTEVLESDAPPRDTSADNAEAMKMYEAFLRNELSVAQGGYDGDVGGYYLSDFIENKEVLFGEYNEFPVRCVQYAYIDCGKDGKRELAIRFERDEDLYNDASIYVLSWMDDQLVCCYTYGDWYRNGTELNEYGFLNSNWSGGASYYGYDQSVIGADGNWNTLVSYEIEGFLGSSPTYGEWAELGNVIIENGGIPEGIYLEVITVILRDTDDQEEERYYTFQLRDNGNVLEGEDIYSVGYYKEIFDAAGVSFCKPNEIEKMVEDKAALLGVTEEIRSGAAADWIDLDISAFVSVEEDNSIHRYELILADVTWEQAYYDCLNRGGYLAQINTQEEFDAICRQILAEEKSRCIFWLGSKREEGSYEYYWLNENNEYFGDPLNSEAYADFWLPGEPSFSGSNESGETVSENCLELFYRSSEGRFFWNDAPEDIIAGASFYAGRVGYICEYE